jgi:hypothetical protein
MLSAGGTVHRGATAGRKRRDSSSAHRELDAEYIECGPIRGLVTNISSSQSMKSPKYSNPFTRRDHELPIPKIHVQKETTITTEARLPRSNSFDSEQEILSKPPPAVLYGNNQQDARHSGDTITQTPPGGFA